MCCLLLVVVKCTVTKLGSRHHTVFLLQRQNTDCGGQKTDEVDVDKKNKLDVTFCIPYFSSNSCSTCFGQPCAHHQELKTG